MDTNSIQTAPKVAQCVPKTTPGGGPKVLQSGPKMNQSYPSNQNGTDMDRQGADMKPTRTRNITRKNVYFLFMDPFGADSDTIQPATTHIIPAIRHLHARSCPKVTPKWTQSRRHMPKVTPKWTRSRLVNTNSRSNANAVQVQVQMQFQCGCNCNCD